MGYPIQQSTAVLPIVFGPVVLSSDHITPVGDLHTTIAVTISKNGSAFAAPAGAISFVGNGYFAIAANATDSNTLGPIVVNATVATADPFDDTFMVVAYNPLSATNLGLSALPTANPNAANGLPTFGTGAGQINLSSGNVEVGSYASGQDPATLVLDVLASGHNTANTIGAKINSAGSAGDPWATTIPGSYGAGTAGLLVGNLFGASSTARLGPAGLDLVVVETGVNARQALVAIAAACAGVCGGAGTTTITYAAANNAGTNRITATVDTAGDRSAVTLVLP